MKRYRISLLLFITLTTLAPGPCTPIKDVDDCRLVTRIIDGDTIELEDGEQIRYIGADTPETVHPAEPVECYGPEATEFNKELVNGKFVCLEYDRDMKDRWGRTLAYVYLHDGTFVNAELIRQGYARAASYAPNTKHSTFFAELEAEAREAERGLWGECVEEEEEEEDEKAYTFEYQDLNGNDLWDPGEPWWMSELPSELDKANDQDEDAIVISSDCVEISYILADAPGREPDGEIIEFENNCDGPVDIGGWRLSDKQASYPIPSGETIPPHGTWRVYGWQYNPTRYTRGLFLNNNSDCVYLYDKSGELVDSECW